MGVVAASAMQLTASQSPFSSVAQVAVFLQHYRLLLHFAHTARAARKTTAEKEHDESTPKQNSF